jgi:flagellar protein FlgJ
VPVDAKLQGLGAATGTRDASTWLDVQGLGALRQGAEQQRPEAVRKVAQQFEQLFLGMMLKSMRDAKLGDSAFDSDEGRLYQDMFDKQVTLEMAQGKGIGIAEMLVKQLAPAARAATSTADATGALAMREATGRTGMPLPPRAATPAGAAVQAPAALLGQRAVAAARDPATARFGAGGIARAFEARAYEAAAQSRGAASVAPELAGLPPEFADSTADAVGDYGTPPLTGRVVALASADAAATDPATTAAPPPAAAPPRAEPAAIAPERRAGQAVVARSAGSAAPTTPRASSPRRFADSPEDFVRKVLPHARAAAAELGVATEAIVAQAALETGWGRRVPQSSDGAGHNLFGIKAGASWGGSRVGVSTLEVKNGLTVRMQAAFRAYDSIGHAFRDYVELIRNSGRYGGVQSAGRDPARFAQALQSGGYATDPHYAQKILQIVNGSTLREAMAAAAAPDRDGRLVAQTLDAGTPVT